MKIFYRMLSILPTYLFCLILILVFIPIESNSQTSQWTKEDFEKMKQIVERYRQTKILPTEDFIARRSNEFYGTNTYHQVIFELLNSTAPEDKDLAYYFIKNDVNPSQKIVSYLMDQLKKGDPKIISSLYSAFDGIRAPHQLKVYVERLETYSSGEIDSVVLLQAKKRIFKSALKNIEYVGVIDNGRGYTQNPVFNNLLNQLIFSSDPSTRNEALNSIIDINLKGKIQNQKEYFAKRLSEDQLKKLASSEKLEDKEFLINLCKQIDPPEGTDLRKLTYVTIMEVINELPKNATSSLVGNALDFLLDDHQQWPSDFQRADNYDDLLEVLYQKGDLYKWLNAIEGQKKIVDQNFRQLALGRSHSIGGAAINQMELEAQSSRLKGIKKFSDRIIQKKFNDNPWTANEWKNFLNIFKHSENTDNGLFYYAVPKLKNQKIPKEFFEEVVAGLNSETPRSIIKSMTALKWIDLNQIETENGQKLLNIISKHLNSSDKEISNAAKSYFRNVMENMGNIDMRAKALDLILENYPSLFRESSEIRSSSWKAILELPNKNIELIERFLKINKDPWPRDFWNDIPKFVISIHNSPNMTPEKFNNIMREISNRSEMNVPGENTKKAIEKLEEYIGKSIPNFKFPIESNGCRLPTQRYNDELDKLL